MSVPKLTEAQGHALGIIGGAAFGMAQRGLTKAAKELSALGLVTTTGAHSGHNRSTYHWDLTASGREVFVEMVRAGAYPLAQHTDAGRAALKEGGK